MASGQNGEKRGLALEAMAAFEREIVEYLNGKGDIRHTRVIALDMLGEDSTTTKLKVRNALRRLVREGHVGRVDRSMYSTNPESLVKVTGAPAPKAKGKSKGSSKGSPKVAVAVAELGIVARDATCGLDKLRTDAEALFDVVGVDELVVVAALHKGTSAPKISRLVGCSMRYANEKVQALGVDVVSTTEKLNKTDAAMWLSRLS